VDRKLGNECPSEMHAACSSVLLALAQLLHSLHLTFGVICPERVVWRAIATDVVSDSKLAHFGCDVFVRFGVPPARSAACDNFLREPRLEWVHYAVRLGFLGPTSLIKVSSD
jgi:hypothetical protein